MKLGLLGGTFDPLHRGHLWLAETARDQLGLDQVLFLPVGEPPHKQGWRVTAVAHRIQMLQLAIADQPAFAIDTTDVKRQPPHTTATLLPLLHQKYPMAEFWWLVGTDSVRDFATWHEPATVIAQCRLAALPRPGVGELDWQKLETAVPGLRTAVDLLDGPQLPISATKIRRWAAKGRSVRYLVGTAVNDYIRQHNLYTDR